MLPQPRCSSPQFPTWQRGGSLPLQYNRCHSPQGFPFGMPPPLLGHPVPPPGFAPVLQHTCPSPPPPLTKHELRNWQDNRKKSGMSRACIMISAGCRLKIKWHLARASDYWIAIENSNGDTLYHPGVIYFPGEGFCVNARLVDIL